MNRKVRRFAELCGISRRDGLTEIGHKERISLCDELIKDGFISNDGEYNFVNKEHKEYFLDTIKKFRI